MTVDYNPFSKSFSESRKNMIWEEIDYFLELPEISECISRGQLIGDIGCGNGRLISALSKTDMHPEQYIGYDMSQGLLEEAGSIHTGYRFEQINMLDIVKDTLGCNIGLVFFIASFHHLKNLDERCQVLKNMYDILDPGGIVCMTNWALDSDINKKRYGNCVIPDSQNRFGSMDYSIKFGDHERYYHGFDTSELEYLSLGAGFEIIENRLFNTQKNYILIIKKPLYA